MMPTENEKHTLTWRWLGTILLSVFIMGASAWALNVNGQIVALQREKEEHRVRLQELDGRLSVKDAEILGKLDTMLFRMNKLSERVEALVTMHLTQPRK